MQPAVGEAETKPRRDGASHPLRWVGSGRRPGRAAAGVARCSWERGRRSGCEDKFLGFDAESPRVRKSKDGCAHSRRLQNCRTVETARAPVIERGVDARGSGSREKRGGADSRHGVDGRTPNTRRSPETPGTQGHTARDSTDVTGPDRRAHRQEASGRTPGAGGDCLLTGTGFFFVV